MVALNVKNMGRTFDIYREDEYDLTVVAYDEDEAIFRYYMNPHCHADPLDDMARNVQLNVKELI